MTLFGKALQFAAMKHAGQKRRNGDAYIIHPIRVSQSLFTEKQKVVALLHDTIEDTDTTYRELSENFGSEIAVIVSILSKEKDEPYADYINRVKSDPDAVQVKLADIADNLNDTPTGKAIKQSAEALTQLLSPS